MAIWFNDTTPYSPTHQNQYYMDGDSSIEDLPTLNDGAGKGSMAFHLGTGQMSVLGSNGQWSVMRSGGGSGSGSGSGSNTSGLNSSYYLISSNNGGSFSWYNDDIPNWDDDSVVPIVCLNIGGNTFYPMSTNDDDVYIYFQYCTFVLEAGGLAVVVLSINKISGEIILKGSGSFDLSGLGYFEIYEDGSSPDAE